jgi:hypothetical protein
MNLCPHSIPLDDYCPKCEAIEREAKQDREDAAFDHYLDRKGEHERATLDEQMWRDERIMGGGR